MPSFKLFLFFVVACLLCLGLLAFAETKPDKQKSCTCNCSKCSCQAPSASAEKKPTDKRTLSTDSGSISSQYKSPSIIDGKTLDETVTELRKARDPSDRTKFLRAIIMFRDPSGKHIPVVAQFMHDRDGSPKWTAIKAMQLMYIPKAHKSLVFKELDRCLMEPTSEGIHRYEVLNSLIFVMTYRFGPPTGQDRKFIFDLVRIASSSHNSELRAKCIDAIITAGPDKQNGPEPRVTDALIRMANPVYEPAKTVRIKAIMALGALGRPQDPKQLEKVVYVLNKPANYKSHNRIIRMWTHVSLMALGEKVPKKEVDAIVKLLDDPESRIKMEAINALGALREKGQAFVGNICDVAKQEFAKNDKKDPKDPMLLMMVAQALPRMGVKGKQVLDTLIQMTELDEIKYVPAVLAACQALKQLGVNDAGTIQALEKVAKHASLDDPQKDVVKKLIEEMKDPPRKPFKDAAKAP